MERHNLSKPTLQWVLRTIRILDILLSVDTVFMPLVNIIPVP